MSDLDPAVKAELWRFDKYLQRRGIDGRRIVAAEFEKYWDQYLRDKRELVKKIHIIQHVHLHASLTVYSLPNSCFRTNAATTRRIQ